MRSDWSLRPRTSLFVPLAVALALAGGTGLSATAPTAEPDPHQVLARVDGKPITQGDFEKAASAELLQLEREYTQARRTLVEAKLKQMARDAMVATEAKAKGVNPEQLIADAAKIAPVTDAEVEKFYEEKKTQIPPNVTKEQVVPQIRQYLEQQRQTAARQSFYTALESRHKADYLLEPIRVPIEAAAYKAPAKGPESAPVTIVEFSDFQCPFCSRLAPVMAQVEQKYGDKVRVVFRQYPLASIHPNATKAAEAALCANDQGKFWEMHDAMFADQAGLAVEGLRAKATKVGLQADPFNACLDSGKHVEEVKQDLVAGSAAGVGGTPAMFVNGRFLAEEMTFETISKMIDDEYQRREKAGTKS